jgi:hypothetical protein
VNWVLLSMMMQLRTPKVMDDIGEKQRGWL